MEMKTPLDILKSGSKPHILALFRFTLDESDAMILTRFGFWARYFCPTYFKQPDASFHKDIDTYNLAVYRGTLKSFTNIVFRGGAKTARTKLFIAFCILNDKNNTRKYIKVLTKDLKNGTQFVTDIYNILVDQRVQPFYPGTFEKSNQKREETMQSFTTSFGVKLLAGTVGMSQRGALQDSSRPDLIVFDDFETSKTLRSAVETHSIWLNMEEAKNSLAPGGGCIYLCNYLSERGNVHKLVTKENSLNKVMIVPIWDKNEEPAWWHPKAHIEQLRDDVDDFAGEYLCEPAMGHDVLFDRDIIDSMEKRRVIRSVAGFSMYYAYDPSHRFAIGADVGGGVGLDSSASVFIDFDTVPARVVATYQSNEIKPDSFGDELKREAEYYGEPVLAPEKNNVGYATIGRLKQIYPLGKLYETRKRETVMIEDDREPKEYGWHTNALTKPKMFNDLAKAVNDGLLVLSCPNLIAEARSYTRNDLMDSEPDPRLTTRHFDLLTACAIAWQMRNFTEISAMNKKQNERAQAFVDNYGFDPYEVI